MTMQKQRGSANSETKPTERRSEDEDYNPITVKKTALQKCRMKNFSLKTLVIRQQSIIFAKQNNKHSLLGRKQRSQVARSFPNRYQFSCINKVTSLFSISCISRIILERNQADVVFTR